MVRLQVIDELAVGRRGSSEGVLKGPGPCVRAASSLSEAAEVLVVSLAPRLFRSFAS